jgi:hypothetical protein
MDELTVEIAMAFRVVVGSASIELKEGSFLSELSDNSTGEKSIWKCAEIAESVCD